MRLHVGKFGTEEFARAINGKLLDFVDLFAATIPALAGIAFGILVREAAALSRHDRLAGEVFTRDELDVVLLTMLLPLNDLRDGGIIRF